MRPVSIVAVCTVPLATQSLKCSPSGKQELGVNWPAQIYNVFALILG